MSTGKMDSSTVYALFEELKQRIDEIGKGEITGKRENSGFDSEEIATLIHELRNKAIQKRFTPEQIKELQNNLAQVSAYSLRKVNNDLTSVLKELKAIITPIDEKLSLLQNSQNAVICKKHGFIVDFRNSKAAITIITMVLLILLSWGGNIWQFRKNNQLKDNDLKYRYIKMEGKTSPQVILQLETIFTYDRDRASISAIRERVETYERSVKEQAEKIEQTRLNVK